MNEENSEKNNLFNNIYDYIRNHQTDEIKKIVPKELSQSSLFPKELLQKILSDNDLEKDSLSIEELAVIYSDIETLDYFNTIKKLDTKLLNIAVKLENINVVQKLLQLGVNPSPILVELPTIPTDIFRLLLQSPNIDINYQGKSMSSLCNTIKSGNIENLKLLLQKGVQINFCQCQHIFPLFYATFLENVEAVKLLLSDPNCDPNFQNFENNTALHRACYNNNVQIINLLLQHEKIDPNIKTNQGITPLQVAVMKSNFQAANAMIHSPKVKLPQCCKQMIKLFILSGCADGIITLRRRGVDISQTNDMSSLYSSVLNRKIEITRALLSFPEIDINVHNFNIPYKKTRQSSQHATECCTQDTPLHVACKMPDYPLILLRLLILHPKIDVNARDDKNNTPLYFASKYGNINAIDLLLEHEKIIIDPVSNNGMTPFMEICDKGTPEVAAMFLDQVPQKGTINVNQISSNGFTPLMLACYREKFPMVKFLIENCKEINPLINTQLGTAFGISVATRNEKIISYLFERGFFDPTLPENGRNSLYDLVLASLPESTLRNKIISAINTKLYGHTRKQPNPYISQLYV